MHSRAVGYVLVGPKGEKTAFAFDEKDGLVRVRERQKTRECLP